MALESYFNYFKGECMDSAGDVELEAEIRLIVDKVFKKHAEDFKTNYGHLISRIQNRKRQITDNEVFNLNKIGSDAGETNLKCDDCEMENGKVWTLEYKKFANEAEIFVAAENKNLSKVGLRITFEHEKNLTFTEFKKVKQAVLDIVRKYKADILVLRKNCLNQLIVFVDKYVCARDIYYSKCLGGLTISPELIINSVCSKYIIKDVSVDIDLQNIAEELLKQGWNIFFVLRKKFTHISALHVIHHSLVAWGVWIGIKFGAGGSNAFFPFINCFVHTIMYTYYCLAALGPGMKKYLWWKKYLTIIQMVQFVIAFAHAMVPLFYDCGYHKGFAYAVMAHALLFMVMFMNFYRNTYNQSEKVAVSGVKSKTQANGDASYHKFEQNGNVVHRNGGMAVDDSLTKRKMNGKEF